MPAVITPRPRIVPPNFVLLSNWRYLEYSLLRIIAGWGRSAADWTDKLAVCYHTWLQAEIVDRFRKRLDMFPGGRPDAPVHPAFEHLANAILLAPNFTQAQAAIHQILNPLLTDTYRRYISSTHPVHDRPTVHLLTETLHLKQIESDWYTDYRTRHPHSLDPAYRKQIDAALRLLNNSLLQPIEPTDRIAATAGINTDFRLPQTPGRVKNWDKSPNVIPFCEMDWNNSIEARRLFFMIGYCWEMGVAEQQLRWIYHADFMPFDFIHAESRHLWDESRHGDSGYHRLKDFGLDFEHFGYSSYGATGDGSLPPMTPKDVYENFYGVTQIAETGYFATKRYCFEDFANHGDDASAEMMQYDIIDETSHVEYGRQWLDEIAKRAGVTEDYRPRALADRHSAQQKSDARVTMMRRIAKGEDVDRLSPPPDTPGEGRGEGQGAAAERASEPPPSPDAHGGECVNPGSVPAAHELRNPHTIKHYRWLLNELRGQHPFQHPEDAPQRPNLPM